MERKEILWRAQKQFSFTGLFVGADGGCAAVDDVAVTERGSAVAAGD